MPQATENRDASMRFTKLLCELISIASVNPMGRPLQGAEYFEARLTEHLEDFFHSLQLPTLRQPVAPHRDNILVRLDASGHSPRQNRLLLWDVHQDTVPADHMTIDPFTPRVDGQRVYGRGSCDVKGGMAAMLGAILRLVQTRPPGMPTLVLACTVNEEYGFSGAAELTRLWSGRQIADFLGRRPDACIVAEPTGLQTVVSHKGSVRWKCHTSGKAAHSSQPELGSNAIYQMGRVIECLEIYARDIVPHLAKHPLCGSPTLSVGTIGGGTSVNTVPERCTIEIDRRLVPGESSQDAYQHAISHLASLEDVPLFHESPMLESAGLADSENASLAAALSGAAKQRGIESRRLGVAYGTNAAIIAESGVPTVVFGPGSIAQAHTADEWIDIREVEAASDILFDLAASGPW
jgi:acetylornithine deacetylase